jgi:3-oxoacyl-[acyl-carrier-protein] synthase III
VQAKIAVGRLVRRGIGADRAHDTLAKYGNLFHSSLPVTFADALDHGRVKAGDVVLFARTGLPGSRSEPGALQAKQDCQP